MVADTTGSEPLVLVDDPAPRVRRLTLNRPEKRNAINNDLRIQLYDALHAADRDPNVGVSIIRGAGPCFSSGYDLKSNLSEGRPFYTPGGDGTWSRHVAEGWSRIWDLAKPVIAQVHGYAMAGGTELMASCDLVYIAEDAQLSYPVVRVLSPPDFQFHLWLVGMRPAMELMLTGDAIDGREAVRIGMANRAFPEADLERETLAMAVAGGVDPERPPADQQAHRAPGDGVHGRAHRDARGFGAPGAGEQPRVDARVLRRPVSRGQERGTERLTGALTTSSRRRTRSLPASPHIRRGARCRVPG